MEKSPVASVYESVAEPTVASDSGEEEEEQVNYDIDAYFTELDESARGDDAKGPSYISDAEAKPVVGAATTAPPSIAKPSVTRHLVSIVESSESKGDVLISLLLQGDGMGMPPRSDLQIGSDPTAMLESPIGPWVEIANVDIEPMHIESIAVHIEPTTVHIEPTAIPTTIALVTQRSEPLVVPTIAVLDMPHSKPLVITTPISSASIDILSVLASLTSYFMSSGGQLKMALTELPLTTESLAMVTEPGPSRPVEAPSSPDSEDSAESEIQILVESLMTLFNQSVESSLTVGKGLSSRTKQLLRSQLKLLASVVKTERVEPYNEMIDQAKLHFLELQCLREADVTADAELEFHHLTVECRKLKEAAHREVEEVNSRL